MSHLARSRELVGMSHTVDEVPLRAAHSPVLVAALAAHFACRQHVPGVEHHLKRRPVGFEELGCLGVRLRVSALIYMYIYI